MLLQNEHLAIIMEILKLPHTQFGISRVAANIRSSGGRNEMRYQGLGFFEATYTKDAKADDVAFGVHALHYGVVRGFFLVTSGVRKPHFKKIGFRVEPDCYCIGHKSSPALGLSVK